MIRTLQIKTRGKGLYEFTSDIEGIVRSSDLDEGLCTIFVRHTSASLLIQENADPSVKRDLEGWFSRLVQEGDTLFTHTTEGEDDMPAHIRSALTQTSIGIPIVDSALALGTWQGLYLWEHRTHPHRREVVVHIA